ncbi:MAG: amidohydrolase family protein [Planctomycetaceae bacterium]|nr:amidohydrolase [Planctomycetaceae bacterium]
MSQKLVNALIAEMAKMQIIDCHEHLHPEKSRVDSKVDAFTFFSHYTSGDIRVANLIGPRQQDLLNHDIPLAKRWELFEPTWKQIRYTSYSRAALIALKKFYSADDFTADNVESISAAMNAANTPGIYRRVLRDACNIKTSLTQCGQWDFGGDELMTPVMPLVWPEVESWRFVNRPLWEPDTSVETLDQYLAAKRRYVADMKSKGVVGLKTVAQPYKTPNRAEALAAFESLKNGSVERLPNVNPLRDYVVEQVIAMAAEADMVVCVHTGYWGDFRDLSPAHMIPILQRNPNARFDIYHVGYPYVREALMLGKGFHNVWTNFCWTHIISQKFATDALDEAVDLLPANKLLAFGGDYGGIVEKVYGHLVMAREDIATVLARRIENGQLSESAAIDLARRWFCDNPKELYRLKN